MSERDFEAEFDELVAPLSENLSDEAIEVEWRVYLQEDLEFRRTILKRIAELTGVKTGEDFFSDEA